jgi:hypothetical protein
MVGYHSKAKRYSLRPEVLRGTTLEAIYEYDDDVSSGLSGFK